MTAISVINYKIQNEVATLEEMEKRTDKNMHENTKDHDLTQEMSRHGGKPMSIKSLLRRNSTYKEKVGYACNLSSIKEISNFIFTNVTEVKI